MRKEKKVTGPRTKLVETQHCEEETGQAKYNGSEHVC